MGPPSRYKLLAAAHAREAQAYESALTQVGADTTSLSVTELGRHFLQLLAAASSPEEFSSRAGSVFARNVNVTVNGIHLSRELYAQQWGASFNAPGTISFTGDMETPNVRIPMLQNAALVGIMYEASFRAPVVRPSAGARSQLQLAVSVTSTINLIIGDDKTLPASSGDRRRVVSINQVIVDKDGLLTFPIRNP